MTLDAKLKESLEQKYCMRFFLKHPNNEYTDGVVLHHNSALVVFREEYEFDFDGIVVVPRQAISGYEDDSSNKVRNEILRQNAKVKLQVPGWLRKCESMEEVFRQLQKRDIWPSVDVVEGNDAWFYLGSITHVEEEGFNIRPYSGDGIWEEEVPIGYASLVRLLFGDRYSRFFNRYMRAKEQ